MMVYKVSNVRNFYSSSSWHNNKLSCHWFRNQNPTSPPTPSVISKSAFISTSQTSRSPQCDHLIKLFLGILIILSWVCKVDSLSKQSITVGERDHTINLTATQPDNMNNNRSLLLKDPLVNNTQTNASNCQWSSASRMQTKAVNDSSSIDTQKTSSKFDAQMIGVTVFVIVAFLLFVSILVFVVIKMQKKANNSQDPPPPGIDESRVINFWSDLPDVGDRVRGVAIPPQLFGPSLVDKPSTKVIDDVTRTPPSSPCNPPTPPPPTSLMIAGEYSRIKRAKVKQESSDMEEEDGLSQGEGSDSCPSPKPFRDRLATLDTAQLTSPSRLHTRSPLTRKATLSKTVAPSSFKSITHTRNSLPVLSERNEIELEPPTSSLRAASRKISVWVRRVQE